MPIIDSHSHIGGCNVFDINQEENALLEAMDKNGVDAAIVQPFPGAGDPVKIHDAIAALAEKNKGRVFGMVNANPHMERSAYRKEVERCLRDLKFVGIKFHTIGHAVSPISNDGGAVFELAREFKVPVMIHTGSGIPFASPSQAALRAMEYADVPVVLAHAGYGIYTQDAYVAAKVCPNIYLETSWCTPHGIKMLVTKLGPERVMYGSDLIFNIPVEVAKATAIDLSQKEKDWFFHKTAAKVFSIKL